MLAKNQNKQKILLETESSKKIKVPKGLKVSQEDKSGAGLLKQNLNNVFKNLKGFLWGNVNKVKYFEKYKLQKSEHPSPK